MGGSYNTEESIKECIEELEKMASELKDCLLLIEYVKNKDKSDSIRREVKRLKQRAKDFF